MISFDTNHLLRHVLDDDPIQCAEVQEAIDDARTEGESIHLFDLVLMETCWVLQSAMGFNREAWCYVLNSILLDPAFRFDDGARLQKALHRYRVGKADFNDDLFLGYAENIGAKLKTFDRKLKKRDPTALTKPRENNLGCSVNR